MSNFHNVVSGAIEERAALANKVRVADALKVLASNSVILNISDGHNHGTVNLTEDDTVMIALREKVCKEWEELSCG